MHATIGKLQQCFESIRLFTGGTGGEEGFQTLIDLQHKVELHKVGCPFQSYWKPTGIRSS